MKSRAVIVGLGLYAFCQSGLFAQGLQLLTPSGAQLYQGGQQVAITWNANGAITGIDLGFSFNGGTWYSISNSQPNSGTYTWTVPYFKTAKSKVWIKIAASGLSIADSSAVPFSIAAAIPDQAEPNNSRLTATVLALGDTLHGLVTTGYGAADNFLTDSLGAFADSDFFAITVAAGKMLYINCLPELAGGKFNDQNRVLMVALTDSTGTELAANNSGSSSSAISYAVTKAGTYYCAIVPSSLPPAVAWYDVYGITAHTEDLQTILLSNPVGPHSYNGGDTLTVAWSGSSPQITGVDLSFSFNKSTWYSIAYNRPNTGAYPWTVPYFKTAKSQVWIKIAADGLSLSDSSRTPFSIAAAVPDQAEPNNSRATAKPLTIGDTLHGLVTTGYGAVDNFLTDSLGAFADSDFFAITVPSAKLIFITTLPELSGNRYNDQNRTPIVEFTNPAGALLTRNYDGSGSGTISCAVTKPGTYYCAIVPSSLPTEVAWYNVYGITAQAVDLQPIVLTNPVGTHSYNGGDTLTITWSKDSAQVRSVDLSFSFNNSTWYSIVYNRPNTGAYPWTIPYFKTAKPQVWIRIAADGLSLSDSSATPFSIAAAVPDKAEPNNSRSTATPLALGDTIHGLVAMGYGAADNFLTDSLGSYSDSDFFATTVPAAKLLSIRMLPELGGNRYNDQNRNPVMEFTDSAGTLLARNYGSSGSSAISCAVTKAGTYYCGIVPSSLPPEVCWYSVYGITVRVIADLEIMNIGPGNYVPDSSKFLLHVEGQQNNVSLSILTNTQAPGTVTFASMPADTSIIKLPDNARTLSIISIDASSGIRSSMDSVTIGLGYADSALKGAIKTDVTAMWYNDSAGAWQNISCRPDTQNNSVNVLSTHFSIYGLFFKAGPTRNRILQRRIPPTPGASVSSSMRSINARFVAEKPGMVKMELYTISGRLIASAIGRIETGNNEKTLTIPTAYMAKSGIYVLRMEAPGFRQNKIISMRR